MLDKNSNNIQNSVNDYVNMTEKVILDEGSHNSIQSKGQREMDKVSNQIKEYNERQGFTEQDQDSYSQEFEPSRSEFTVERNTYGNEDTDRGLSNNQN